jgi:hypothetical protein
MRKFLIKEDIKILGQIVLKKDQTITVEVAYTIPAEPFDISMPLGQILKDSRFEEIPIPELNIEVKELTDLEEDEVKTYRIQLDVKTSRRKLREIENHLRVTLEEML